MPAQARGSKTGAKTVAGAIPLGLALLGSAVVSSPKPATGPPADTSKVVPVICGEGIEDYLACHSDYPTGCSGTGKYDAYLNEFKNMTPSQPSSVQGWFASLGDLQTLESKLPDGLKSNNHGDFIKQLAALGEGRIHGVVGYLYSAKAEGKESSNCELEDEGDHENVDFHIYVGFDPNIADRLRNHNATPADKKEINPDSMIVEMTPQYRGQFHPEWTLDAVKQHIGEQVRVEGQLMVDNEHYLASQDCGRSDATDKCWRGTVWELHPITDFKVCSSGNCTATGAGWQDIGQEAVNQPQGDGAKSLK
jgi:hypothetical protein